MCTVHTGNKNNALIGQEPTQEEIVIIIAHICNISHRTESNVAIIYERQTMDGEEKQSDEEVRVGGFQSEAKQKQHIAIQ